MAPGLGMRLCSFPAMASPARHLVDGHCFGVRRFPDLPQDFHEGYLLRAFLALELEINGVSVQQDIQNVRAGILPGFGVSDLDSVHL